MYKQWLNKKFHYDIVARNNVSMADSNSVKFFKVTYCKLIKSLKASIQLIYVDTQFMRESKF